MSTVCPGTICLLTLLPLTLSLFYFVADWYKRDVSDLHQCSSLLLDISTAKVPSDIATPRKTRLFSFRACSHMN